VEIRTSKTSGGQRREVINLFQRCLGQTPAPCNLEARVERTDTVGPWRAQWLRFRAESDEWVTAVLILPEGVRRPPVVICHHGYSGDKERSLFGRFVDKASSAQAPEAELIRFGVAVLGVDARCHGGRAPIGAPDPIQHREDWVRFFESEWQWLARRCLIDGTCLQALLIHDVRRAIDYLQTREDVDGSRLGMYGYSMGGTTCWATTVVEPRIKVAAAGGCLINYEEALRVRRDASWHAWVPAVRTCTSREELLSTIAPHPLLTIHGEEDFPRQGVQPILDAAASAYTEEGCPDHFRSVFLPGDHTAAAQNPRLIEEVGRWFARHL